MARSVVKLAGYKTRIGGRRFIMRLGHFVTDLSVAWSVPWGQYEGPVFVRLKRMRWGFRFALRLGSPYLKWDVQYLPGHMFGVRP